MAILQKLKSLLGLGDSRTDRPRERDVGVTVERESSGEVTTDAVDSGEESISLPTDDESEDGVDAAPATEGDDARADDGIAARTDASSSTDTMVEPTERPEAAAEPAEATGPTAENAAPTAEKAGESVEPVPVNEIKGIGPAYSDRLADAGVMTVSELAAADAAELAAETDIAEKRIQGWIDRANVR